MTQRDGYGGGLESYRDWHPRFMGQDIKLSPTDENSFPGGVAVTVCDGTKHRTIVSGSCDLLASITPCDHACVSWKEAKGRDVRKIVPNLSEKWFTTDEDVDRSNLVRAVI